MGLKPSELFDLELWEYNSYVRGTLEREKSEAAHCIMTGYYTAYYTNGGRKTKSPNELIGRLQTKKQSREDGLREIERVKALEKRLQGD